MSLTIHLGNAEMISSSLRRMIERMSREGPADDGWTPQVDIYEDEAAVVIVAAVAGVSRDKIKVLVDGQVVRIFGQRGSTSQAAGAHYHRLEIETGPFVRSFRINVPFVAQEVTAGYRDGLLYITLPKAPPARSQRVPVKRA